MEIFDLIGSWLGGIAAFALAKVFPAVIILVIGILAIQLVMKLLKGLLERTRLEKAAHSLLISVARVALYLLLGLIVASNLGIDVTGIVALASVLTLAISLSVQTALTNLIGGFTLLSNKPFAAGDFVEIAGQSGTVQEVGLTYTKLNTADNKVVSIPNSAVVAAQIVNYSASGTRRVEVRVSASYDTPVEKVLEALKEAACVPTALQEPAPTAAVSAYGESAIEYVLFVWCKGEDYWTTQFDCNKNVKAVFDAKQVQMTYPHIHVHMDK